MNAKWEQKLKVTDISNFLHDYDVILVSEPWISIHSIHLADLPGYTLLHCLRPEERLPSGGLLLYIKSNLPFVTLLHQPISVEHIIVVQLGPVTLTAAYLPPVSSRTLPLWSDDPMSLALSHLITHGGLLMGDLNAHAATPPDNLICARGRQLIDCCREHNLRILPLQSHTFLRADGYRSVLDHVVVEDSLPAANQQTHPQFLDWSDHAPVSVIVSISGLSRIRDAQLPYRTLRESALATTTTPLPAGAALTVQKLESSIVQKATQNLRSKPAPSSTPPTLTSSKSSNKRRLAAIMKSNTTEPALVTEALALRREIFRERKVAYLRSLQQYRDQLLSLQSRPEFWKHVARFTNTKGRQPLKVSSEALVQHFAGLFQNVRTEVTHSQLLTTQMPQPTAAQHEAAQNVLATPFSEDELAHATSLLNDSCPGEDRLSLEEIRTIPPQDILELFAEINISGAVPESWKRVIVVPIPKPRADPSIASNLRGISLQPTLKKIYSIMVNQRIMNWAEASGILPKSQNGFRPGRMTGNNAYVIRIMHETAVAQNKRLYLVSLDLAKAYDSVNRDKLFTLLRAWGLRGPIFSVLRELYTDTFAAIRQNGHFSAMFPQNLGVAQGDPLSCILFIIYIALINVSDPDDLLLDGCPVESLWLVDDLYIVSTTESGCQRKIDGAIEQATELDLRVNYAKCEFMGLGTVQLTDVLQPLYVNGHCLRRVWQMRVNGVDINTGGSSIHREGNTWPSWITASRDATLRQLAAAGRISSAIKANQRACGLYTPNQLFQLYRNLIRSHFVYGAETIVDCGEKLERDLDAFEARCLKSSLSLSHTASPDILRFDFALPRLSHFRVKLALRYVVYLLRSDLDQPACWAFRQAVSNVRNPKAKRPQSLWLNRLIRCVESFKLVDKIDRTHLDSLEYWKVVLRAWETAMEQSVIDEAFSKFDSPRLAGIRPYIQIHQSLKAQHYLLYDLKLARAVAVLRTSTHHLAIETYRYKRPIPPREERCCSDCPTAIEDEYHTVNKCKRTAPLREALLHELGWNPNTPRDLLRWCVNPPLTGGRKFCRFLVRVWEIIDERNRQLATDT